MTHFDFENEKISFASLKKKYIKMFFRTDESISKREMKMLKIATALYNFEDESGRLNRLIRGFIRGRVPHGKYESLPLLLVCSLIAASDAEVEHFITSVKKCLVIPLLAGSFSLKTYLSVGEAKKIISACEVPWYSMPKAYTTYSLFVRLIRCWGMDSDSYMLEEFEDVLELLKEKKDSDGLFCFSNNDSYSAIKLNGTAGECELMGYVLDFADPDGFLFCGFHDQPYYSMEGTLCLTSLVLNRCLTEKETVNVYRAVALCNYEMCLLYGSEKRNELSAILYGVDIIANNSDSGEALLPVQISLFLSMGLKKDVSKFLLSVRNVLSDEVRLAKLLLNM